MTEQPEGCARESKKAAKSNIEQQSQPEPIDKQDPTEPVKVTTGAKEQKRCRSQTIAGREIFSMNVPKRTISF
jgi:hypothetical protein